jgi:cytochrome c oxidase subunit 2
MSRPAHPSTGRLQGDHGSGKVSVALVLLWLAASTALVAYLAWGNFWHQDAPLNTFNPKGTSARTIQDLVTPVFVIAGVVFLLVEGIILGISIRRRKGVDDWAEDTDFPEQSHGNTKLEVLWTAIPALILAVIAVQSVTVILELNDFDDTEMVVQVEGQQWWWQYTYDINGNGEFGDDGDIVTANEMVIPAGVDVEMRVTSNDVIHSFWIPELNGKRDAVPGFATSWKMQADEPGRYRGTCTEFCGLSHARMQMYVIALAPDDYEAWEANQLAPAVELAEGAFDDPADFASYSAGRDLFAAQCTSCHQIRTDAEVLGPPGGVAAQVSGEAPNLTHLMSRDTFAGATLAMYVGVQDTLDADTPVDNYVAREGLSVDTPNLESWLRNPEGVKPMAPDAVIPNPHGPEPPTVGRGMPNLGLSEDQIDDLVAYLTTLK